VSDEHVHHDNQMSDDGQRPTTQSPARGRAGRWLSSYPVVTVLIALNLVVFVIELLTGGISGSFDAHLYLDPTVVASEPWTLLTTLFVHVNALSLLAAAFSLFSAGPLVERVLGHSRFIAVYLIGGFAGGVLTVLTNTGPVAGAGPATLALLGALLVIYVKGRAPVANIVRLVGVNLVINVLIVGLVGGFAWIGTIGGFAVGAVVTLIYAMRPSATHPNRRNYLVAAVVVLLVLVVLGGIALD
jgi:membrane associated rhomboid family serine protease